MTVAALLSNMSLNEFIEWNTYDEMTRIMSEVRALDKTGKMPEDVVISMTTDQQEKHDWIGRIDPKTIKRKSVV